MLIQKNGLKLNRLVVFLLCLCLPGFGCLLAEDFFKLREKILEGAWKKIAFFYITPTLTVENVGYTSNIYSYNALEEPDWTADLGLNLQVSSFLGNRFILVVNENPSYLFYAKNKDYGAFNNRLEAALYTYLGRFNLEYRFDTDYIMGRPTAEFGVHARIRTREHQFSLDYGRHDNFFINLYLKQGKSEYDDERYLGQYNLKHSLNREELRVGINLNKIIFSRTRLFLNFEYFEQELEFKTERNGIGKQVSLGIEFPAISRIKGSLEFGLKAFNISHSLYKNYTIPFGSGKVTIELFRRFRFHFQYLVDNFYTFWQENQRFNQKSMGAGVEFYLGKGIKLGYTYRLGRLTYENLTDGDKTRQDDFHMSGIYLGIRVFKKFGIGLEYRRFRANSNLLAFTRNNDFIGGYITHEF